MQKVIIDTSIWIDFYNKPESDSARVAKELLSMDAVVMAGPVLTEIYQGARTQKELAILKKIFGVLKIAGFTESLWEFCGVLGYQLRTKGFQIKTIDLIIAEIAIQNKCLLYSSDTHFEIISKYSRLNLFVP